MATKKSKKKSASQVQDTPVLVHGFKGFDKNWQCRGKQYAPNSSHEELGAKLCNNGLHFCEHPLDCFGYYAPGSGSVYAEVSAENPTEEKGDDTKRVTKKLHIGAELTLSSLTQAALKFVFDRATWVNGDKATGDRGAAAATGYLGAASATGDRGAASATGCQGAASATGDLGAASATGDRGAASATGDQGAASATGDQGAASATGDRGAAAATGYQGAASATGCQGAASATGDESVALSTGYMGRAKAASGSWIVLAERDDNGHILGMRCAKIDGEVLKPNIFYTLLDGEFVEAKD